MPSGNSWWLVRVIMAGERRCVAAAGREVQQRFLALKTSAPEPRRRWPRLIPKWAIEPDDQIVRRTAVFIGPDPHRGFLQTDSAEGVCLAGYKSSRADRQDRPGTPARRCRLFRLSADRRTGDSLRQNQPPLSQRGACRVLIRTTDQGRRMRSALPRKRLQTTRADAGIERCGLPA